MDFARYQRRQARVLKKYISACRKGNQERALVLLDRGYPIDGAIQIAAKHGLTIVVERLLNSGIAVDDTANDTMKTPLIYAIINGHMDVIELLIERGAYINFVVKGGAAIHMACRCLRIDVINRLISLNCKLDFIDVPNCRSVFYDLMMNRKGVALFAPTMEIEKVYFILKSNRCPLIRDW